MADAQPLSGRTISHYRVLGKIGGGGMGVVYKAEDTKLKRLVALKFLPENVGKDRVALERFRREAQAASAINHPNICTIYDIDEVDGMPFIAMELLAGETLKHRMSGKALKLDSLLEIASGVAKGLDAAHSRGIIHRDLKPGNIFISGEDEAKILDFGLAKQITGRGENATLSLDAAPMEDDANLTSPGTALGTVAYMSPEQVLGEPLDARSDLFSFGLVVYEMATARQAFTGATAGSIFHAILEREPVPAAQVNAELPAELDRIIGKALEKDLKLRYQTARDLVADLQRLKRDTDSGSVARGLGGAASLDQAKDEAAGLTPGAAQSGRRLGIFVGVGLGLLAILGAAALLIYPLMHREPPLPFQHFTAARITNSGKVTKTAISADGRYVLNVVKDKARESLWLFNVGTSSNTQITAPEPLYIAEPVFSPDGDYVYYLRAVDQTQELFDSLRVPVLGGAAQTVIRNVDGGVAFSPDAKRMVFIRLNDPELGKYYILSANLDGSDEQILLAEPTLSANTISWSPDGKRIADAVYSKGGATVLRTFDLATKKSSELAKFGDRDIQALSWAPNGRGIFINYRLRTASPIAGQIGFVSFPGGTMHELTNDLNGYQGLGVSKDGKSIATVQMQATDKILLQDAAGGKSTGSVSLPSQEMIVGFDWLNDAEMLIAGIHSVSRIKVDGVSSTTLTSDPNANLLDVLHCGSYAVVEWQFKNNANALDIWRMDLDGRNPIQISYGPFDQWALCSPDGKSVYFYDQADGKFVMHIPIDGGAAERLSFPAHGNTILGLNGMGISRDGKWMATSGAELGSNSAIGRVWVIGLDDNSNAPTRMLTPDPRFVTELRITPDGKFVTYVISDQGAKSLWAQPVDGGPGHAITEGDEDDLWDYRWSPDAKTLGIQRKHFQADVVLLKDTSAP
ncbi:MAG: protein kinase [Candidatus Acidiferrales bacterium]